MANLGWNLKLASIDSGYNSDLCKIVFVTFHPFTVTDCDVYKYNSNNIHYHRALILL